MKTKFLSLLSMMSAAGVGLSQTQPPKPMAPMTPMPMTPMAPGVQKKDDKPKPPSVDEPPPPVTIPAISNRNLAIPSAALAAGTSFTRSSQPNVYGNFHNGQNLFSPYLVAGLPNGQHQTILPGQTVQVPVGTVFNQPVQTQVVSIFTQIPNPEPNPNGHNNPFTTVRQDVLQVTGLDPIAHAGGLPINVVRGAFKIGENESPRPQDRFYATYNFFSNVNSSLNVPGIRQTDVHRETLGFEKTFLDGQASVGLRLPLLQVNGPRNIQGQGLGDLSIVLKYALINEAVQYDDGTIASGNALSTGLVITAPTGNTVTYAARQPIVHSTILQPYLGGILAGENAYVQGFTSIAVPMDDQDTIYIMNSVQLGYYLWRDMTGDRILRSITPIVECHIDTPLNNRGIRRLPIGAIDTVSITSGATLGLGRSAFLNLGMNVPLTGPKPYNLEALAQFNWRF